MKKKACEKKSVKNRPVVDRDKIISIEPAMRKLKKIHHDMKTAEQDRTEDYLKDKINQEENEGSLRPKKRIIEGVPGEVIKHPSIEKEKYRGLQDRLDHITKDISRVERRAKVAHLVAFITVLENTIVSLKKVMIKFAEDYEKDDSA